MHFILGMPFQCFIYSSMENGFLITEYEHVSYLNEKSKTIRYLKMTIGIGQVNHFLIVDI